MLVIDTETTGLEETDKIVEIASVHVTLDGIVSSPRSNLVNPGIPIPPIASSIHHLVDEDVDGCPSFDKVKCFYESDVYIAQNAAFDKRMTGFDGVWICTKKCAMKLWPEAPNHSNQVLRYWLKLEIEDWAKDIMPHRALHDCVVTAHLFGRVAKLLSFDEMVEISSKPSLLPKCHFGKHRDKMWKDVPHDYMQWCLKQDMDEDVLYTCRYYLGEEV